MTIDTQLRTFQFDCSTVTVYDFDFKIFRESDLKITLTDNEENTTLLELGTDYTITIFDSKTGIITSPNGVDTYRPTVGGRITLTQAYPNCVIKGERCMDILQPMDIPEDGYFPEDLIENAFDRACMISQQLMAIILDNEESVNDKFSLLESRIQEFENSIIGAIHTISNSVALEHSDIAQFKYDTTQVVNGLKDDISEYDAKIDDALEDMAEFKEDIINFEREMRRNYPNDAVKEIEGVGINAVKEGNKVTLRPTTYIYEQATPSDTWVIEHNLGKCPHVTLIDQYGKVFGAEREYPEGEELNKIIVHTNGATTGKALLN